MAIPDPGKGPNPSPWMCPRLIQPISTLIHHFSATRLAYGHKMAINGHLWPFRIIFKALWRPPMAIPDPGKGPNSSPRMCPDLIQPRSTQIHQFGAARSTYGHKRAIYGLFEPFWDPLAPPMAIPDLGKGPNTSPWMCPNLIQPISTLIHHFGGGRPTYGHKRAICGLYEPF